MRTCVEDSKSTLSLKCLLLGKKKSTDEEEIPERENFEKKDSPDFRIEKYFEENFDESFEAENKNLDENSREEKGDKSEN